MKVDTDLALVLKAAAFAADKHRDQRRKDAGATPYINHPLALASLLANDGGVTDAEILAAALLHDTIEDTETSADELRAVFGDRIASIVLEVTDDKSIEDKSERKRAQAIKAPNMSTAAKLVKLADKTCNLRDILATPPDHWTPMDKGDYFDSAVKVVAGLRGVNPRLESVFDAVVARRP